MMLQSASHSRDMHSPDGPHGLTFCGQGRGAVRGLGEVSRSFGSHLSPLSPLKYFLILPRIKKILDIWMIFLTLNIPPWPFLHFLTSQQSWIGHSSLLSKKKASAAQGLSTVVTWEFILNRNHFSSSLCEKSFKDSSQLREDLRVHTGEKQCGCSLCPKSFARPHNLEAHSRIHTGEKTLSCTVKAGNFVSDV
jgi:hypothetical protein